MQTVISNNISIAYTRHGKGAPLVLIHGYPLDHSIWNDIIPYLENDFDLIIPDLRGFGQSQSVDTVYSLADMAADIAGLLDALKIEKACLAGHSMGGYLSLAFARAYPERVLGLALVASQIFADPPERKEARYATAAQVAEQGANAVLDMAGKFSPDARVQDFARKLILAQKPSGIIGALKAIAERPDSTGLLQSLKFPVVIIHGGADALVPVERAREAKAIAPQVQLVELPGAGHMPGMEYPRETAQALKTLL